MTKKRKNNIYTRSYLRKSLINGGFFVKDLLTYSTDDIRQWTMLIDDIVLITCCKQSSEDFWFRLSGKNDCNMRIETQSSKILINILNELLNSDNEEN